MNIRRSASWLIMLLVYGASPALMAQQSDSAPLFNVYRLASEASVEVDNDLMVATLYVQAQDKDTSSLAQKINSTMEWATAELKPFTTITVQTRDYQTYPRYENNQSRRLIGWTARQSIELETDDFTAAGKAIQRLQEKLLVEGIRLSVKSATRQKAEDLLIEEALDQFKDRARLVQKNMNAESFNIIEMDIQTQGQAFSYQDNQRMLSQSNMRVESAPQIAAGSTTVNVSVSGRIQLD